MYGEVHSLKCSSFYIYILPQFPVYTDVDECSQEGVAPCSDNATCFNEVGGFTCSCNDGFTGNGLNCLGTYHFYSGAIQKGI